MKKIIFKFWLINIPISIILYFIYRFSFMGPKSTEGNFIENLLDILKIVLNLAYSFIYLIGMILCSLTIFLNLINRIRNNYFYSLLTFLGIPLLCVIYFLIIILIGKFYESFNPMTTFVSFSIIYLLVLIISCEINTYRKPFQS